MTKPETMKAVREALDEAHALAFEQRSTEVQVLTLNAIRLLSADEASQQECPKRTCSCLEFWDSHPPDCPCCGTGQQDREGGKGERMKECHCMGSHLEHEHEALEELRASRDREAVVWATGFVLGLRQQGMDQWEAWKRVKETAEKWEPTYYAILKNMERLP